MLNVKHLTKEFAGIVAVDDVSFDVPEGSITSLIGPNGAGKTTMINLCTGILHPSSGEVAFQGRLVSGLRADHVARAGIRRTFQTVHLFPGLTVEENLVIARFGDVARRTPWLSLLPPAMGDAVARTKAAEVLEMLGLSSYAKSVATELSYGSQRRVEIARSLCGNPRMLLLDEPAAGMNTVETEELQRDILLIAKMGVTILLVEHDMTLVMGVSDKIVVLNFGRKIAEGTPDEIRRNDEVIASYLGAVIE